MRNDTRAYNVKAFPFGDALEDLRDGVIVGLAAWQADRFTRQSRHGLTLLDTVKQTGGRLATVGGEYNLATAAGRKAFRDLASNAEYESDLKSERGLLQNDQAAKAGKRHGGGWRAFGYEADKVTVRESEAALIRDAGHRLDRGESVYSILADWHAAGIRTTAGKRWSSTAFRRLMTSPRVAGLRQHGRDPVTKEAFVVGRAEWDAILDERAWERVKEVFDNPERRRRTGRSVRYLLAGFLRCGKCGESLVSRLGGRRVTRAYGCPPPKWRDGCGRTYIVADKTEAEVVAQLLHRLAGPKLVELRRRAAGGDRKAERLLEQRREDEAELKYLARLKGQGRFSTAEWLELRDEVAARIKAADAELHRRPKLAAVVDLPDTKAELEALWASWSVDQQRALLKSVVDYIVVGPATTHHWDASRIHVHWLV